MKEHAIPNKKIFLGKVPQAQKWDFEFRVILSHCKYLPLKNKVLLEDILASSSGNVSHFG